MIAPCQGGWCQSRDKCQHYVNPNNRHNPADRLCEKGAETVMFFKRLEPQVKIA